MPLLPMDDGGQGQRADAVARDFERLHIETDGPARGADTAQGRPLGTRPRRVAQVRGGHRATVEAGDRRQRGDATVGGVELPDDGPLSRTHTPPTSRHGRRARGRRGRFVHLRWADGGVGEVEGYMLRPTSVPGRAAGLDSGGKARRSLQEAAEGGGLEAKRPARRGGHHRGRPGPSGYGRPFAHHVARSHVADVGGPGPRPCPHDEPPRLDDVHGAARATLADEFVAHVHLNLAELGQDVSQKAQWHQREHRVHTQCPGDRLHAQVPGQCFIDLGVQPHQGVERIAAQAQGIDALRSSYRGGARPPGDQRGFAKCGAGTEPSQGDLRPVAFGQDANRTSSQDVEAVGRVTFL